MRTILYLIILTLSVIAACTPASQKVYSSSQPIGNGSEISQKAPPMPNGKPGSCYGKAMIPDSVEGENVETMWTEVVCEKDVTSAISQVRTKLIEMDYISGEESSKSDILLALRSYQRENHLPIGNLNLETLDMLGVTY